MYMYVFILRYDILIIDKIRFKIKFILIMFIYVRKMWMYVKVLLMYEGMVFWCYLWCYLIKMNYFL